MAEIRKFIKVFLASPGDLAEERKIAKAVVEEFNSQLATVLGYQIELVGWEDTLPGVGRPQEIINRDLDGCDLFIGMLWKRWGTPPGTAPYTSGFEEEFKRSLTRNENEGRPELNLLLKDIDQASLIDPGDHLKKVIAFKEQIFLEKKLLAGTFSDSRDFEGKLRKCLQGYVISLSEKDKASQSETEKSPASESAPTPVSEPEPTTPLSIEGAKFLREFLVKAEKAKDDLPLVADDIARVRLLSTISGVHGNDQQSLGSHDANLLFKSRTKFEFGSRELNGLLSIGLAHFENKNVPLWHWILSINGFKKNLLPIWSLIGTTDHQIAALKSMRLILEPIQESKGFGRAKIISLWISNKSATVVRIAALQYLSDCGLRSDIPQIEEEFKRNETQTSSEAANAIISILLRDDRTAALEALYTMQPDTIKLGLIEAIFSHEAEFDNNILMRGHNNRNLQLRKKVIKLLRKRNALPETLAESLLDDSSAELRFEALQVMIENGRNYSIEQVKSILVRSPPNQTAREFLLGNNNDIEGDLLLELYIQNYYDSLTESHLQKEEQTAIFDQNAYFSLVRRNFKLRGDELRKDVANRFVDRFDILLKEMEKRHGSQTNIVEKTRNLGSFLRRKFTRNGLDIICQRLDPVDLPLVRSMLEDGSIDYSHIDLAYLAKHGQWRDIPLVISSIDLPDYIRNVMSINSSTSITKYENAARTIYALGKHDIEALLSTEIPANLLSHIISIIPDKSFHKLSDKIIKNLMQSEGEEVRKQTSLKYIRAFSRNDVRKFLNEYMTSAHQYYNIIHWLDFGVSIPRDRVQIATARAMATN